MKTKVIGRHKTYVTSYSLTELFDRVAGYSYLSEQVKIMRYDPTKLLVARNLLERQFEFAAEAGVSRTVYNQIQMCYGAKVDDTIPDDMVVVLEGFFIPTESGEK